MLRLLSIPLALLVLLAAAMAWSGSATPPRAEFTFAMTRDVPASDGEDGPNHGDEEEDAEDRDRDPFRPAAVRHGDTEVQPRERGQDGRGDENPAGTAVEPDVPGSNARGELERREREEQAARQDVEHRHERGGGKTPVEPLELRRTLRREGILPVKSVEDRVADRIGALREVAGEDAPADHRAHSDNDEQGDADPQRAEDERGRETESGLAPGVAQPRAFDLRRFKAVSMLHGPGPAADM